MLEHYYVGYKYKVVLIVMDGPVIPAPLPVYTVQLITIVHKFVDGRLLKEATPALTVAYSAHKLLLTKISEG